MAGASSTAPRLRVGMVGLGMIFKETYRPAFEELRRHGHFARATGLVEVELAAIASRTGSRAESVCGQFGCVSFAGPTAIDQLLQHGVDVVCIATPDDRHFPAARAVLAAGKHVLIEKPSVLTLGEWKELVALAQSRGVLAKVAYHKLLDPDHKRLRTLVADGELRHVNHGFCSLFEPKQISGTQFAEWVTGRNPATYVAVHYVKLIDFIFFHGTKAKLSSVSANGQRGQIGPAAGPTWDSVQLRVVYAYPDGREAAFDIHSSWVLPDNFPGHVEQEVQFHFDNGVWNASQRKRGVELTIEGRTPHDLKAAPNHHYNAEVLEPWGERRQRGYGVEAITRFFEEAAFVEFGGTTAQRPSRLQAMRDLAYNDLGADRSTVQVVDAIEGILKALAAGGGELTVRF